MSGLRDPTRSLGLRRHGRALVTRKVFGLHRDLRMALQEQDLPMLRQRETVPAVLLQGDRRRITPQQRADLAARLAQ